MCIRDRFWGAFGGQGPNRLLLNKGDGTFTESVQKMFDSGQEKPVAFSSGLAIMMWTLMNARNGKDSLATDHPLPNAARVVLTGNPTQGWTLVDWDGITSF